MTDLPIKLIVRPLWLLSAAGLALWLAWDVITRPWEYTR